MWVGMSDNQGNFAENIWHFVVSISFADGQVPLYAIGE